MTRSGSSRDIDAEAARWVVRLDRGELSPAEHAALDAWLAGDTRHFGAFAKARAVSTLVDRAAALQAGGAAELSPPAGVPRARARVVHWTMAAGAVMAAVTLGLLVLGSPPSHSTRLGETRVVPLQDGSVVTLNTNTRIGIRYSEERRDIELLGGEALFDVASDAVRPFVVTAGDTTVRAVGTSFTVRRLPRQPVEVLVREGVVEVLRPEVPVAPKVQVVANTRALVPESAPIEIQPVDTAAVNRELSWRMGRLAFEGESLREAAEMFSRYSDIRIMIDDPAVAERTITGLYMSNDPVGFSRAVALSMGLRVEVGSNEVRLAP